MIVCVGLQYNLARRSKEGGYTHKVYDGLVAHVALGFPARRLLSRIVHRSNSVLVISPQTVDDGLDRLQCPFVKSKITG